MEKIASFLEIMKLGWSHFGHQIGYITHPDKKMEELNKNARYLFARRDDVEKKTRGPPNVATSESTLWLDDVKQTEFEVKSIQEDHTRRPNIYSRMKLGKRVRDAIEEISNLNNKRPKLKGKEFSNAPLERVELQPVEANSSTNSEPRLQKISALIEDVRIGKIGIWGMGGIGKTRTLKLLNNRLEEFHMFEIVIWVTVSGEGSRRKVQNVIAERLNCASVIDMSDDQLRAFISKNLRGKKFLLILDDIWKRIDLCDVGVPDLNQDNGCKVLLTTRDLDICRQMQTDMEIQMEKLSEEEAWSLFNEKAGDVAMSSHIEPIARDIVKKCSGLPLAIIVIGSSLRKNGYVAVWRSTLRRLQSPSTSQIQGTEKEVFSCLRISYDQLPNDFERNLFLYCSLYPEDHYILITELVEYCWLEGYIQGVDSIEEARDDGRHMVMQLVDASLLERCGNEEYVKMHDIIRDFALKEASGFLVKTGKHVKHPPEEKWLQSQKISLMMSNLCSLLERPKCSTLCTLLLQYNDQLTMIPDSFFECMHSLCILDLSETKIKSLPTSLCNLVNLRGLYLKDCRHLKVLPSQVGALRKLEVLDLGGSTGIRYLPREVGELTHLKRLIVGFEMRKEWKMHDSGEWNIKLRVPTGIIPKLPYLEELSLYVYVDFEGYVEKDQWDDESMEVVVEELCRLEHLTYLDAYFPKVECLEHFLSKRKSVKATSWFRRFRFRVGAEIGDRSYMHELEMEAFVELQKCWLVYRGGLGMLHAAAITETLAHSSFFYLLEHRRARKLSELGQANMKELKGCYVRDCEKMETLFDVDELQEACALLPNLEILDIQDLPELRSLCDGPLLPGSLSKLRDLYLSNCENLKKVFQLGIIRQLCSLEELYVSKCSKMEEIIEIEEASHTHNVRLILPNIKNISFENLPELVSICRGFSNFEWPSLETIEIRECPKLKSLSFLSNGTDIVAPAGSLSKLRYLVINDCENLKIQLGIIRQLCSLEELHVSKCSKMEEIIEIEEEEEISMSVASHTRNDRLILPNIKKISLRDLPELVGICRGFSNFEWPSLETIQIERCPKLKSLSFLSNGTDIVAPVGSFSKLRFLEINDCENLKKVFQLGIIRQLCSLKFLSISSCRTMEEIIEIEEEEMSMSVASHTHNIKSIFFKNLPELVGICRGFSNFEWPSLEWIYIKDCPKLKSLSFLSNGTDIVAPALKEIKGTSSWWEEELEWEDNDIKQRLQPFFSEWIDRW